MTATQRSFAAAFSMSAVNGLTGQWSPWQGRTQRPWRPPGSPRWLLGKSDCRQVDHFFGDVVVNMKQSGSIAANQAAVVARWAVITIERRSYASQSSWVVSRAKRLVDRRIVST